MTVSAATSLAVAEPTPGSVLPPHPGSLPVGADRQAAISQWLTQGFDPHTQPDGQRLEPGQAFDAADQSPWALVLLEGTSAHLGEALAAGAELGRPVGIGAGGWVHPTLAILSGPLEEAGLKLRQLKAAAAGPITLTGRWPSGVRRGDALIHLLVTASFSDQVDLKPALAEKYIVDLIEDIMGTRPDIALMRDRGGAIPLHRALAMGRYEVAQRLLQVAPRAQAAAKDHQGNGAFHALVQGGWNPAFQGVARTLGSHGASWHLANARGVSALDEALNHVEDNNEAVMWRNLAQRTSPA